MSFPLYSDAALARDVPEYRLRRGDLVRPVEHHIAPDGESGYSVEVLGAKGQTLAVVTVPASALEPIYEWAFLCELQLRELSTESKRLVRIAYKHFAREEALWLDVLVESCVLVEIKSVAKVLPIHKAQLLSYMKLLRIPVGLLINLNVLKLTDGVRRMILSGANR